MAVYQLSQIKTIVNQYVAELKKYDIKVSQILLYGSYAHKKASNASDIDIVVISKDLERWQPLERLQLLSRATINIDAPLEVLGYTPSEIKKRGKESIFWEEIMQTAKLIYKKAA